MTHPLFSSLLTFYQSRMVSRLIAKGANVFATDRDGRDALGYLQLSVQQQHQSDRFFHESGREILFVLQKTQAKMEMAQQRQALRHQQQTTSSPSPSSPYSIQPSQDHSSSSSTSSPHPAAVLSSDVERGNDAGEGMGMGNDDYVVDIYCRDTTDMDSHNHDFSDTAVADGPGLGSIPGLGLGHGQETDQRPRLGGRTGDDLVHLSATATVVQVYSLILSQCLNKTVKTQ